MNTHFTFPALYLSRTLLLQRLQRQQVVTEDEPVVEDVVLCHPMLCVIRIGRTLQQDARLQLGPVLLADPGELEFLFDGHADIVGLMGV